MISAEKIISMINKAALKTAAIQEIVTVRVFGEKVYNATTGQSAQSYTDSDLSIFNDKFEDNEIDGTLILRTDEKIIVLGNTVIPVGSIVTRSSGLSSRVINFTPYKIGSTICASVVQLRK